MEKAYPTRNGLPISTHELDLVPSILDPNNPYSWNNHHLHYESSWYKGDLLTNTLRNLEGQQERTLRDQHNLGKTSLHAIYGPPQRPTIEVVMNRLDQAHETEERLKIWDDNQKMYVYHDITEICWKQLLIRYNERKQAA